jgi:GNAT superfamily N-acetyltransferase
VNAVVSLSEAPLRDWPAAVDLLRRAWKDNRETSLDYSLEFVESLARYPGAGPVLIPALYDGDTLVAFVAGFPRTVRLHGQTRRLLLMTFFTVDPAARGRGYGRIIWANCLRQAKAAGYDGAIHYCVEGNPSNAITIAGARAAGFEARRVFTVSYWMRLLRPLATPSADDAPSDPALLLDAAAALAPAPLTRLWTPAEAEWQMTAPGRLCAAADGGVLTGYVLHTLDAARTACCFVDDVLWDRVPPDARPALLDRFLATASRRAGLAVLPLLGYADLAPFRAAGFRRSPRLLHAYLTLWDSLPAPEPFPGMYLEVL